MSAILTILGINKKGDNIEY